MTLTVEGVPVDDGCMVGLDPSSAPAPWPPAELAGLSRTAWRVADVLRRHGPSTRADLVATTRLSRPTVSSIVRDLVDEGWAEAGVATEGAPGRPAALVRLARRAGLAVGVDIGRRHIRVVVVDAGHRELRRQTLLLAEDADDRPMEVLEEAARFAINQLAAIGASSESLIGAGLAIPAPLTLDGRIGSKTWLPKWASLMPGEIFGGFLHGVKVTVGNDASLGGLGEYVFGEGRTSQNLIYVKAATGIGAGFVINGRMYQGAAGIAGEIGHMTLDHHGDRCRCGNRGCLELYAGGSVILARAREAGYHPENLAALVDAAKAGDHLSQNLVLDAGRYIGAALGAVVNVYGPDRVIIGGELSDAGEVFLNAIRESIRTTAMPVAYAAVDLQLAPLRSMSTAMGAAAVVLRSRANIEAAS
jgi:predicted NBD/HSP70 family sugar kinase